MSASSFFEWPEPAPSYCHHDGLSKWRPRGPLLAEPQLHASDRSLFSDNGPMGTSVRSFGVHCSKTTKVNRRGMLCKALSTRNPNYPKTFNRHYTFRRGTTLWACEISETDNRSTHGWNVGLRRTRLNRSPRPTHSFHGRKLLYGPAKRIKSISSAVSANLIGSLSTSITTADARPLSASNGSKIRVSWYAKPFHIRHHQSVCARWMIFPLRIRQFR